MTHNRSFYFAARIAKQSFRFRLREVRRGLYNSPSAVGKLCIGSAQIYHQVTICLTEPNHCSGAQHVEHELGGRPRLHARRTADDLRSNHGCDAEVTTPRDLRIAVTTQANRERTDASRILEATQNVWRASTGSDSHYHVAIREPSLFEILNGKSRPVFGTFHRCCQRGVSA